MSQITVRIPDGLRKALEKRARRTERKPSDIVRTALTEYLRVGPSRRTRPIDRVESLVGSLASGTPHLAERHRKYILESLRGR